MVIPIISGSQGTRLSPALGQSRPGRHLYLKIPKQRKRNFLVWVVYNNEPEFQFVIEKLHRLILFTGCS